MQEVVGSKSTKLNRSCSRRFAACRNSSVNASVRRTLAEDAEDLATFERCAKESNLSFEEVLKDMKRRDGRSNASPRGFKT
jgi:hypothetical protein